MKIKSHIVTEEDDDDDEKKHRHIYEGARNMQEKPSEELMDEESVLDAQKRWARVSVIIIGVSPDLCL